MPETFQSFFFPESGIPIHSAMICCGHMTETSHSYRWSGRHRGPNRMNIWQYTLSGRGEILIGDEKHVLTPGTAFFVTVPGDNIYFLPEDSERWEFLYIATAGCELRRLADEILSRFGPVWTQDEDSPAVKKAWEILNESIPVYRGDEFHAAAMAYDFTMTLISDRKRGKRRSAAELLTERVNARLKKHIAEKIEISELAEELGYSRSHFSRMFHAATGQSPQDYIRDLRIKFAARLLQTTRCSIKEAAAEAGFSDSNYLCRVFRRMYGTSPGNFRNSGKT